jgi:hypothetical protein
MKKMLIDPTMKKLIIFILPLTGSISIQMSLDPEAIRICCKICPTARETENKTNDEESHIR